jgi:DNA-binding MarR family transcriptional regulator
LDYVVSYNVLIHSNQVDNALSYWQAVFAMQMSATRNTPDISGGLAALFREVSALGIRLKVAPVFVERDDALAAGGLSVLRVLEGYGAQTVPQIARLRGTSRQNIQILVNRLEAEGCVELSLNPAHKRSELVQLTLLGRDLFAQAAEHEAAFLTELASRVPEAEVVSAAALLRRLREMLAGGERLREGEKPGERRERSEVRGQKSEVRRAARTQKVTARAVIPDEPESDEGELPYNLL